MKIFKNTPNINFLNLSKYSIYISISFFVIGSSSLFIKGIQSSIDFTGGTMTHVEINDESIDLSDFRNKVNTAFNSNFNIVEINSNNSKEIVITSHFLNEKEINLLKKMLNDNFSNEIKQIESIGPKMGNELRINARNAIIASLFLIGFYITIRFNRFYAIGSLVALLHDIFIIISIFSIFNFEISIAIIAAFLTIVGYSLNDTIVIYDRIRENILKHPKDKKNNLINKSLNETLSRTIITSLTTLFVVIVLYIWGGQVLEPFALALIIGVLVGTYSSLFVASPIMFLLDDKYNIETEEE